MTPEKKEDIVKVICESYLSMTDNPQAAGENLTKSTHYGLVGIASLCELLRGGKIGQTYPELLEIIETVQEREPGALRLLAAESIVQLEELGFTLDEGRITEIEDAHPS